MFEIKNKINVFISSDCKGKFGPLREDLKKKLESTKFINVYSFEAAQASTLTAEEHYSLNLMQSHLCVFLIERDKDTPDGVQKEIDIVNKYDKKAMYYFCVGNSKKKSALQLSLEGPGKPKYKEVESFDMLLNSCFQGLIDDISFIYEQYCNNQLVIIQDKDESSFQMDNDYYENEYTIPKTVIADSDKTRSYIHNLFVKQNFDIKNTNDLDKYCCSFLDVLLAQKTIEDFNVQLLLQSIHIYQPDDYFDVVSSRWSYIQLYFLSEIEESYKMANVTLELAKSKKIPNWVIKDILIDTRNIKSHLDEMKNTMFHENPSQKELDEYNDPLFYPIIDRLHESLNEKYLDDIFKESIKSPNTVMIGNTINGYTDIIASSYIVAMFNGSLTHILLLHKQFKRLSFYLSQKYSNWEFRMMLMKETIFSKSKKEIDGILNTYTDIVVNLNSTEAEQIYVYCSNEAVPYRRFINELLSMKIIGYILSDEQFDRISKNLFDQITLWIQDENKIIIVGQYIFDSLESIAYRISQDSAANICISFIEKNLRRFYPELLKFLYRCINFDKLSNDVSDKLIDCIIMLINEKEEVHNIRDVIIKLSKQNQEKAKRIEGVIKTKMPNFYSGVYILETTRKKNVDYPLFIKKYIDDINQRNENQGKNGAYLGFVENLHDTLRAIFLDVEDDLDKSLINSAFENSCNTLLSERQDIATKCDAIDLLIMLTIKYPESKTHNEHLVLEIVENSEKITNELVVLFTNYTKETITFLLNLLLNIWGYSSEANIIQVFLFSKDDISSQNRMCETVEKCYENNTEFSFANQLLPIIFQQTLIWSMSDNRNLKYNAIKIMFNFINDNQYSELVSKRLIHLIDNDDVYIKNLILRNVISQKELLDSSFFKYILSKCEADHNFVVRKLYTELTCS